MIEEDELIEPRETPRPKKAQTKNAIERVLIYRKGENTDIGNFHKSIIGEPFEQRLPQFVKQMYGGGDYRIDFRGGARNSFAGGTSFSISDDETNTENTRQVVDIESDETDFDEPEFDLEVEIDRRVQEALQRFTTEREEPTRNLQSEVLQILRESEKGKERAYQQGRESGLEIMKMFMQFQQPQKNPIEMLTELVAVQRGVRELSEEIIAPNDSNGGGSSLLADGAKLISSIGQNAGVFIPMLGGLLGGGERLKRQSDQPERRTRRRTARTGKAADLRIWLGKFRKRKWLKMKNDILDESKLIENEPITPDGQVSNVLQDLFLGNPPEDVATEIIENFILCERVEAPAILGLLDAPTETVIELLKKVVTSIYNGQLTALDEKGFEFIEGLKKSVKTQLEELAK